MRQGCQSGSQRSRGSSKGRPRKGRGPQTRREDDNSSESEHIEADVDASALTHVCG